MDEDSSIRVLYYHNPHLLWVEVKKHDIYAWRQVGLFGMVPRRASLVDGERVCTKSDRWDPRATDIVEEFLESKHQLYFKSTYRLEDDDSQTSIFSNQPHIFGEISSMRKDGVRKQLSNCLDNSVYAYKSRNEFWQMLDEGKIKTKLGEAEEIEVLQNIKKQYQAKGTWHRKKEAFFKYLSPSQVAQLNTEPKLPQKLTTENLEKHQILTRHQETMISIEKPEKFIKQSRRTKKYQDFNCADNVLAPVEFVEDAIKKLTVSTPVIAENSNSKHKKYTVKDIMRKLKTPSVSGSVLSKITVYDEEINPQVSGDEIDANASPKRNQKAIGRANGRTHRNKPDTPRMEVAKKSIDDVKKNKEYTKINGKLLKLEEKFRRNKDIDSKGIDNTPGKPEIEHSNQSLNTSRDFEKYEKLGMSREERSEILNCLQEYEDTSGDASPSGITEERLVAYGPPMNNMQSLVRKLVVKEADDPTPKVTESPDFNRKKVTVDWEDDGDDSDGYCKNVQTNIDTNSRFHKNILVEKIERTAHSNDAKSHPGQNRCDLNDPKGYNDFVQSKQSCIESEVSQSRSVHDNENKKDGGVTMSLPDDNKENQTAAQKNSRNKLLDIMRRRKPKFNDSLSSTDDSLVQKSNTNDTSSTNKSNDHSDDDLEKIDAKLKSKHKPITIENKTIQKVIEKTKPNVNPYKNLDGSKSVFVENLIQPLLLAHTKNDNQILPQTNLRDVPFKSEIHNTLRNMGVKEPSRLQSVSWPYILRGHSIVLVSAPDSGKTLGYLPAVCNIVLDYNFDFRGPGPIAIIVCATALSVTNAANACRMFLNDQRVVACFPGIDNAKLLTDLLNGCAILVSTPSLLYRLLGAEIGVDLRRLTTIVFEDCERLEQVYELEVKAIHLHVKQMLKSRTDKQVKVQYILASRKWCDFMNSLAKKAPDTIITFAAFHECVLYSKTQTSVSFVKKDKKVDAVIEFLKETDDSKLTVIVCRTDVEVDLLESKLTNLDYTVVACNNQMTLHDLYKIRTEEFSSILVCCDGNLKHLNVTHANYLIHFSMPAVYTQFCKRFAVLNDNYASIFGPANEDVRIMILLEETNTEQLPKILHFVKRCSSKVPEGLNEIARKVLEQKDLEKAKNLVIVCNNVLAFGECADMYTCKDRHAILEEYDQPKSWMPCNGVITFKLIHYHTATAYSARLLAHVTKTNRTEYQDTYTALCMKLGMFFSKEENKRLQSDPKVGDICAVATRKSFISRCQVLQISYEKGQAKSVLINLIDEEKMDIVRAVDLYYLPEEFKTVETHVVSVRLASVKPQDNDLTFSELALNQLKKITDDDEQLYLKGRVVMTVGKTIFVSTLEACAELSTLCETVVKYDFKKMLLDTHAVPDPEHLSKMQELCDFGNLKVQRDEVIPEPRITAKRETEYRWAHLDKNGWSDVIFSNTINAGKFFVRAQKFSKCINSLVSDIKNHVIDNPNAVETVCVKDVVLAEFPDDSVYERAIIEEIIYDNKVRCFFVDNADWREVAVSKLKPIPQKFIKQIPFQSIECRLIGVKPPGEEWTEFSTNWLHDNCLEDEKGNSKMMYVKYFTKEKAELTGGHKYGVILVDTTTEDDVVINKRMIELNLAAVEEKEFQFLEKPLDFVREKTDTSSFEDDFDDLEVKTKNADGKRGSKDLIPIPIKLIPNEDQEDWETNKENNITDTANDNKISPYISQNNDPMPPKVPLKNIFEKPIRSFPLVSDSDEDSDKWDVCIDDDLGKCFGLPKLSQAYNRNEGSKQDSSNDFNIVASKRENVIVTSKLPAIHDVKNVRNGSKLTDIKVKKEATNMSDINKSQINEKKPSDGTNIDIKTLRLPKKDKSDVKHDLETLNKTQATGDTKVVKIHINEESNRDVEASIAELNYDSDSNVNKPVFAEIEDMNISNEINEIEPTDDTGIPRGEIKDISFYDSDDTLSITTTNNNIEINNQKQFKRESAVIDSDDTQSILTEIDKESNKSALDSDDTEIEDVKSISENPDVSISADQCCEVAIIKVKGRISKQLENMQVGEQSTKFKGKVIPITENPKVDIAMNAIVVNDPLNKTTENEKAEIDAGADKLKNEKVNKNPDIESISELKGKTITVTQTTEPVRTPQLAWKQDKNTTTIKIKLVVEEYTLETGNRSLKFSAFQNEIKYSFDIELYGVIEPEKTKHSNKGQYILVTLEKLLKKTTKWLKLTKDFKNWIIYDVDSIDTSSDEETPVNDDALKIIMDHHEKAMEMDNVDDDDDMDDTSGYRYRDY